jgi:foldase protein PrsA
LRRALGIIACAVALALALSACGSGSQGRVAIRVGTADVTAGTVAHWMSAFAPGHFVPNPPKYGKCVARLRALQSESIPEALEEECREQYQALRQRALGFVISSEWLIGEARERGLAVPGGELDEQTRAAESAIRRQLQSREAKITQAQAFAYYEQNIAQFGRPERRYIDIVERLPTKAAAQRALADVVHRRDIARSSYHEVFDETNPATVEPSKRVILREIFAAKPHTIVGPVPLNEKWCFFEVTRTIARDVKPFSQVQGTIERELAAERLQRDLVPFIAAWRKKWVARTECKPGYVVQKCSEYRGQKTPEVPGSFS